MATGSTMGTPENCAPFARRLAAVVSQPMEITNDAQLINDTVIRDGAMTWEQICTPAYERFCPPPSERQGG